MSVPMIQKVSSTDFAVACDPTRSKEVRAVAWEMYEVECWYRAYIERALLVKNMDGDRIHADRESMQDLVMRRIKMPIANGIDTSGNPLR